MSWWVTALSAFAGGGLSAVLSTFVLPRMQAKREDGRHASDLNRSAARQVLIAFDALDAALEAQSDDDVKRHDAQAASRKLRRAANELLSDEARERVADVANIAFNLRDFCRGSEYDFATDLHFYTARHYLRQEVEEVSATILRHAKASVVDVFPPRRSPILRLAQADRDLDLEFRRRAIDEEEFVQEERARLRMEHMASRARVAPLPVEEATAETAETDARERKTAT